MLINIRTFPGRMPSNLEGRRWKNLNRERDLMKPMIRTMLSAGAALCLVTTPLWASPNSAPVYLSVSSPDHPKTWTAGALQKSKILRWDSAQQGLVVDVKYSSEFYADSVNPGQEDEHSLAFPMIKLARNGIDLIATNRQGESVVIGRRNGGLFGTDVVLNPGVDLNVHRINGKIQASLTYNALAEE